MQPYWICNEFSGSFHQFVSRIFSTYFSQFEQLEKKKNFIGSKKFISSVCQLKKKSEQIFQDSEFEIGETIRWIR